MPDNYDKYSYYISTILFLFAGKQGIVYNELLPTAKLVLKKPRKEKTKTMTPCEGKQM